MYSFADGKVAFYPLLVTNCVAIFPIFILYFLLRNGRILEIKILAVVVLLCMAICALSTARMDAGAARLLASSVRDYGMEMDRLELMNTSAATFGSVYGMGLIIVAIFYGWKRFLTKTRIFMTFIMFLFLYGLFKAAYSTAVVMTCAGLIFAGIALLTHCKIRSFSRICFSICFALVLITAFPHILGFLSGPIRWLSRQIDVYEYSMRLESIADAFSGYQDAYAVGRSALYWLSFDTFLHNPFIGKFTNCFLFGKSSNFLARDYIGGHSTFFDTLGQLGLLGFFLLALSVRSYRRYLHDFYIRYFNPEGEISCECAYYALLLVSCLNPVITPEIMVAFVFVVPALPLFYEKQQAILATIR